MKISVIVPVYKVERYIRRCLESVGAQDCPAEVECIVVNDCTPDNSMTEARNAIDSMAGGKIRFCIIDHPENRGLSEARNTGIKASTGSHIFLLDSDDFLPPDALRLLQEKAIQRPASEMIVGNTQLIFPDTPQTSQDSQIPRLAHLRMPKGAFGDYCAYRPTIAALMLDNIPVMACNKLYRRELFTEKDLWFTPGILHEDEDWRYRAFNCINAIAFCYATTYYYEIHPESITRQTRKDRSFLSMLDILCRYIPRIERPSDYRRILRQLYNYTLRLDSLENPDAFLTEFRKRIGAVAESGVVPHSLVAAYRYAAKAPDRRLPASLLLSPRSFFLARQLKRMK